MNTPIRTLVRASALVAFALGLGLGVSGGCEKKKSDSPDGGGGDKGGTLCTEYGTCDECIAGQTAKGKNEGEAETECGAAVAGCWTTWKKPVVCHGKEHSKE